MDIRYIFQTKIQKGSRRTLGIFLKNIKRHAPLFFKKKLPRSISVIFVTPGFSRKLNMMYRGKTYAPNVLSFVYDRDYAEVFITPSVVRKEAKKADESVDITLVKMIIHGMIHCSGIHHEKSAVDERKSLSLEKKLIARTLPPKSVRP